MFRTYFPPSARTGPPNPPHPPLRVERPPPQGAAEVGGGGFRAIPRGWEEAVSSSDAPVGSEEQVARSLSYPSETSTSQSTSNPSGNQHDTAVGDATADAPLGKDESKAQEVAAASRSNLDELPSAPDPQNGRKHGTLDNLIWALSNRASRGGEGRKDAGESNPEVTQALAAAERLAAGFVGGAVTPDQRRDLEEAIGRAEAAMSRGTRVLESTEKDSGGRKSGDGAK